MFVTKSNIFNIFTNAKLYNIQQFFKLQKQKPKGWNLCGLTLEKYKLTWILVLGPRDPHTNL